MSRPAKTVEQAADEKILIGTKEAARLMNISMPTLRNYVWLQKQTEEDRIRRKLQSPPKGMPRPEVIKGRNMWPARIMRPWALQWVASGSNGSQKQGSDCGCNSNP